MVRLVRWSALLAAFLQLAGCTRSFQVYDLAELQKQQQPLRKDYFFYALPRTVVTVAVPVSKIVVGDQAACTDSAFEALRQELLLDPPEAGVGFKAGKPTVNTRAEPDPSAVYAVDLRFRPLANTSGTFEMSENGVLTTQTVSQEDQTIDAVLTVARVGLVASGALPAAAGVTSGPTPPPAAPSTAQKNGCAAAKAFIERIRTRRLEMIGESLRADNPNETYLKAALDKLDEIEASLTEQFTGPTQTTTNSVVCELRPSAFSSTDLFQLSPTDGPATINGSPCVIPRSLLPTPKEQIVIDGGDHVAAATISANVASDGSQQFATTVAGARPGSDARPRGFFYRIPGNAVITVNFGTNDVRVSEIKSVAQLGTIATLPAIGGPFVRKAAMTPTLNASGGLTKLVLNGEGGGNAALTSAAELFAGVRAAEQAQAAAEAASKDELTQLERQAKILEEKLKIAKAEKDLAALLAGTVP